MEAPLFLPTDTPREILRKAVARRDELNTFIKVLCELTGLQEEAPVRLDIRHHFHFPPGEDTLRRLLQEMTKMNEVLARLLTEARETHGKLDSLLVLFRGVPEMIRKAVEKALRDNPSLTAEDLAAISAAADDLDAGQAEIDAAIAENQPGGANPEPAPETPAEPVDDGA